MNNQTTNIVLWIVFGALIGWVASAIVGVGSNVILDIVVGIVGAFIGGWIMNRMEAVPNGLPGISMRSFLVSLLGAIILLALVKLFS